MPNLESVKELDLTGKYVVVSGGTQGIGAAIAVLSAQLGATVAIIGRNPKLGQEVASKLTAQSKEKTTAHAFIPADFGTVEGSKEAVARVEKWLAGKEIDYLYECQGGPPPAKSVLNADGIEAHFAVQVLSRFIFAYLLLSEGSLKPTGTIVSVFGAGQGAATINLENIDGKNVAFWPRMSQGPAVVDCMTKEFNARYPALRSLHVFPGLIRTNAVPNAGMPWYIHYSYFVLAPLFSKPPDSYAPVAIWLALNGDKEVWSYDEKCNPAPPSKASEDPEVTGKVWEELFRMAKITP